MIFRASLFIVAILVGGMGPAEPAPAVSPVLVELFTSQGCSDCPPADAILAELARRQDVVALSFPITYWDMLGWKDTLATDANTKRQKAYAQALGRSGTYTPQMIIGGVQDVVGNKRDRVVAGIGHHAAETANADFAALSVTQSGDQITIAISGEPSANVALGFPATLWIMRTLSKANVLVGGGENSDRELAYTNVVRDVQRAGSWNGGELTIVVPAAFESGEHDGVAVILQSRDFGPVLAASLLDIVPNGAGR